MLVLPVDLMEGFLFRDGSHKLVMTIFSEVGRIVRGVKHEIQTNDGCPDIIGAASICRCSHNFTFSLAMGVKKVKVKRMNINIMATGRSNKLVGQTGKYFGAAGFSRRGKVTRLPLSFGPTESLSAVTKSR